MTDINKFLALKAALLSEQAKLKARLAEIAKVLGQEASAPTLAPATKTAPGKRTFSAATKAKMAKAQKARWARLKGNAAGKVAGDAAPKAPAKKKRTMSAEGKANIRAAVKARWAKFHALQAKSAK